MKTKPSKNSGFTLIELIVVLAGLGILSSLAVSNFGEFSDRNDVDNAKAILNTAAADCLQRARTDGTESLALPPETTIISKEKIQTINYEINAKRNSCRDLQITPKASAQKDGIHYALGFRINTTTLKLTKLAEDEATDNKNSCLNWAGVNCKVEDPAEKKKWDDYNIYIDKIAEEKSKCVANFNSWLKTNGNGRVTTWDATGDSGCEKAPPLTKDATCTWNACNKAKYYKDGELVAGESALKAALCEDWLEGHKTDKTTNSTSLINSNCSDGKQEFWFFEGAAVDTKSAWQLLDHAKKKTNEEVTLNDGSKAYLCLGKDEGSKDKMDACHNKNESEICNTKITNRIASKVNGYFKAQNSGPIPCTDEYWFCNGTNKGTETEYMGSDCGKKSCGPKPAAYCEWSGWQYYGDCAKWTQCKEDE